MPRVSYFDCANVCVLCCVLVLVETVLCELAFPQVDAEFNKEEHDRLQGGDGVVSRPLGDDMFVEEGQGRLLLVDADKFLGPLEDILGTRMWWRRHLRGLWAARGCVFLRGYRAMSWSWPARLGDSTLCD